MSACQAGPLFARPFEHASCWPIVEHISASSPQRERSGLTLPELMAALSLATDIGMGAPMEEGLAVCVLAVRFGEDLGLDEAELARIHDAALLRHIGCTAETAEFSSYLGDEIVARAKGGVRVDWGRPTEALGYMLGQIVGSNPPLRAAAMIARLPRAASALRAGALAVCEVADMLAQRFGIDDETRRVAVSVYERWDGKGFPGTLSRDEIPLPARIIQLAETAWVFGSAGGTDAAVSVLRKRSGTAFDPDLVERFCRSAPALLGSVEAHSRWELAAGRVPRRELVGVALDSALRAIGEFADLKSPHTVGHSAGVAELAAAAGAQLGLSEDDCAELRRAAYVHDVGRVGVSSVVWEKPGPLTHGEREQVRLHPYYTERVLARPERLGRVGALASAHHERLDSSGYHRGAPASLLGPAARALAAADAYRAMSEPRPHRPPLSQQQAAAELRAEVHAGRLDPDAVEAVLAAAGATARRRRTQIAGLTEREVEVLRLVARGLSIRQIAERLVIAPKTADAHIQHIYAKIGVSSRAAATVFAMQHDLFAAD